MKLNVIISSVTSFIFRSSLLKDKRVQLLLQSLILVLLLVGCIFLYRSWTKPMYRTMVLSVETMGASTPKEISIKKNLSVFGNEHEVYKRLESSTDTIEISLGRDSLYSKIAFGQIYPKEIGEYIFSRDSLVSDITRLTTFNCNSRKKIHKVSVDPIRGNSGPYIYYSKGISNISLKEFEKDNHRKIAIHQKINDILKFQAVDNTKGCILDAIYVNTQKNQTSIQENSSDISITSNVFSDCDISNTSFNLKPIFDNGVSFKEIKFYFIDPTECSQLIPVPDELDLYHMTYNDSSKLSYIANNGISFSATSISGRVLQENRLNALVMIGTLLFTLLTGLLYQIAKLLVEETSKKDKAKYVFLYILNILLPLIIALLFIHISHQVNVGVVLSITYGILLLYFFALNKQNFKTRKLIKGSIYQIQYTLFIFRKFIPNIILFPYSYFITKYFIYIYGNLVF